MRVRERDDVRTTGLEREFHDHDEVGVRRIIGPQRERAPGTQGRGHTLEPLQFVERGVTRMEVVPGRVVDVDEDRVPQVRRTGCESLVARDDREEVAVNQMTPDIVRELGSEREEVILVPSDHLGEGFDDIERPDAAILEHGARGVSEPESTDEHIDGSVNRSVNRSGVGPHLTQAEPRQRDLRRREQARHQELVAQLHLVDVDQERRLQAAAQHDLPHRRRTPIKLLEPDAHSGSIA